MQTLSQILTFSHHLIVIVALFKLLHQEGIPGHRVKSWSFNNISEKQVFIMPCSSLIYSLLQSSALGIKLHGNQNKQQNIDYLSGTFMLTCKMLISLEFTA